MKNGGWGLFYKISVFLFICSYLILNLSKIVEQNFIDLMTKHS